MLKVIKERSLYNRWFISGWILLPNYSSRHLHCLKTERSN